MDAEREIELLKERNRRVELDKAWETSWPRRLSVAGLTYAVIVVFFWSASLADPLVNAIVPTIGFLLSTLSLDFLKKYWLKKKSH